MIVVLARYSFRARTLRYLGSSSYHADIELPKNRMARGINGTDSSKTIRQLNSRYVSRFASKSHRQTQEFQTLECVRQLPLLSGILLEEK